MLNNKNTVDKMYTYTHDMIYPVGVGVAGGLEAYYRSQGNPQEIISGYTRGYSLGKASSKIIDGVVKKAENNAMTKGEKKFKRAMKKMEKSLVKGNSKLKVPKKGVEKNRIRNEDQEKKITNNKANKRGR